MKKQARLMIHEEYIARQADQCQSGYRAIDRVSKVPYNYPLIKVDKSVRINNQAPMPSCFNATALSICR